jgi:hypothetical protein
MTAGGVAAYGPYGVAGGGAFDIDTPDFAIRDNSAGYVTRFHVTSSGVNAQAYSVGSYAGGTLTGQTVLYAASLSTATVYLRTVSGDLQWYTTGTGVWQSVGAGGIGLLNYASLSTSGVVLNFRSGLYTAS